MTSRDGRRSPSGPTGDGRRRRLSDARARDVGRRGLIVAGLALLVLLLVVDLLRPDSRLRDLWSEPDRPTRGEQLVDEAERRGLIRPRR